MPPVPKLLKHSQSEYHSRLPEIKAMKIRQNQPVSSTTSQTASTQAASDLKMRNMASIRTNSMKRTTPIVPASAVKRNGHGPRTIFKSQVSSEVLLTTANR